MILACFVAIFNSALFLIFRTKWGYIFNDDPEVVKMVAQILPLVALFQVFDGVAAVTGGILRARGKQVLGALLNLSAYYILGLPLGAAMTFPSWPFPSIAMGLHGLWIGLTISLVYSALFGTILCFRTNWDAEVVKVRKRLEKEKERQGEARAEVAQGEPV
jgi:multidrug resistance protein, MATE family